MKRTAALTLFLFFTFLAFAQKQYPTPDFANQPNLYDEATNSLKPLEKMDANKASHITSPWSAKSMAYFPNLKSSVRLSAKYKLQFIVLLENTTQDPSEIIKLYKLETNQFKNRREITLGKATVGSTTSTKTSLPMSVRKLGTGLYLMETEALVSGEYVLDTPKFDFGFGTDN